MRPSILVPAVAGALALALPVTATASVRPPVGLPLVKRVATAGKPAPIYRAPMSGFVAIRSAGVRRGDWDLDVIDAASGRKLGASHGFGSREVVQTYVTAGQRLRLRAVRRSGRARRMPLTVKLYNLAPPKPDGTASLVEVRFRDHADLARLEQAGLDLTHDIHGTTADVIVSGPKQLAALRGLGLPFRVEIPDLVADAAKARRADLRAVRTAGRSPLPSGREQYRVLQDYQDELKALAAGHPGLVKPVVLPKRTFQGREIMGVEISRGVDRTDDGKPTYFVMGMHHAREWPSAEAAMEWAHLLAEGAGKDARVTRLLERERVVVVPIVNVDGFVESREGGVLGLPDAADTTGVAELQTVEGVGLLGGSFAYRRKNCDGAIPSPDVPCTLQYGVDPNRNYGNGWGGPGAGSDPITQSYRGTGPFSEPETQAVWLFSRERQITNLITLHNVAALVLRPPGLHDGGKAPDEAALKKLGDAMAAATGYVSQYSFQLYDTSGTTDDYTYASQGGYAYTIEMGPSGGQFHMPYQTGVVDEWTGKAGTPSEGKGLREALLLGAEAAASPADHAILAGRAPAGRVLRIRKDFQTETSEVCLYAQGYLNSSGGGTPLDCPARGAKQAFDDKVESTLTVPKGGRFTWHVNPSTRPFVGARYVDGGERPHGTPQTFTPTAEENKLLLGAIDKGQGTVEREFTVAAGADAVNIDLTWAAAAQDYDLEVYRVGADGSRQPVGDSGNAPGSFEHVVLTDPAPGKYVLAVVYYTTVANDWTATVQQMKRLPDRVEATGKTEAYTLTCETRDGKVLSTQKVTVARGKTLAVDPCCGEGGPRGRR
jgi:hypothetical protein